MKNPIRKRTAIANILATIALPFFVYLGYKNSNWLLELVCLVVFPFTAYNTYKYFFKKDYRRHLNEYHDRQKALPREERDGYWMSVYNRQCVAIGIIGFGIIILTGIILNFFNLL